MECDKIFRAPFVSLQRPFVRARGKAGSAKAREPKAPEPKLDFTGQQPLGKCPKCGSPVFEGPSAYLCEKSQADKRPCRFKLSKVILEQPIDHAQAAKLLAEGRSDLLTKFISKSGRPFPAFLVMDDSGKATFEFPPRESEPAEGAAG